MGLTCRICKLRPEGLKSRARFVVGSWGGLECIERLKEGNLAGVNSFSRATFRNLCVNFGIQMLIPGVRGLRGET